MKRTVLRQSRGKITPKISVFSQSYRMKNENAMFEAKNCG
jgi:hypothetical protein